MNSCREVERKHPELMKNCNWGIECRDGWAAIVDEVLGEMEGTDTILKQIKQKFGGLRIYYEQGTPAVDEAVLRAERKAATTCEYCGEQAKREAICGWLTTICQPCRDREVSQRADAIAEWQARNTKAQEG